MLLDLVEIKISMMDIADREDARDLQILERCRTELATLAHHAHSSIVPFSETRLRPNRSRLSA
ncbi:MAG TPA: hypothetical protein VKT70_00930 [Stellaceae bacterium]|nr:hypothetical protein [Stellaceae bacterium]